MKHFGLEEGILATLAVVAFVFAAVAFTKIAATQTGSTEIAVEENAAAGQEITGTVTPVKAQR